MGTDEDYAKAREDIRSRLQSFVAAGDDIGLRDSYAFIGHWADDGLDLMQLREILHEEKTSVGYRGDLAQYG